MSLRNFRGKCLRSSQHSLTEFLVTHTAFAFAALALLLTPGPTNTLIALTGAQEGFRRAVRLVPSELLGYATTILPLAYLGAETFVRWPLVTGALKGAAAVWVLVLAGRLWQAPAQAGNGAVVTARGVYLTTTLNPKALVFGLVLLPVPEAPDFAAKLALFASLVVLAALVWSAGGSFMGYGRASPVRMHAIRRLSSVWLAAVSGTLVAALLRA